MIANRSGVAAKTRQETAWTVLATVLDPEVPALSVVDLGIVREVGVGEEGQLDIVLTPTYSGCPATEAIEADIGSALARAGLGPARIRYRLAPPWTTDWISDEGHEKLRAFGIAPPVRSAREEDAICPRCTSTHTEMISRFGSTPCKALHRCLACGEPFDKFKCH